MGQLSSLYRKNSAAYAWLLFIFLLLCSLSHPANAALDSSLKHDLKYQHFVELKMRNIRHYLLDGSTLSARRSLDQAEIFIAKISDKFISSAEGSLLRQSLDRLTDQVLQLEAGEIMDIETAAILNEKLNFEPAIRKYKRTIALLQVGKYHLVEDSNISSDQAQWLADHLADFMAYESTFRQDFARLIALEPGFTEDRIQVGMVLDLFEHAEQYYADLIAALGERTTARPPQ